MKISKSRLEEIITEELEDVLRKAQTQYRTGPLGIPIPAILQGWRATTLGLTDDDIEAAKATFRKDERMAETATKYAIERIIKEKGLTPWTMVSPDGVEKYMDDIAEEYSDLYALYLVGYLETLRN